MMKKCRNKYMKSQTYLQDKQVKEKSAVDLVTEVDVAAEKVTAVDTSTAALMRADFSMNCLLDCVECCRVITLT